MVKEHVFEEVAFVVELHIAEQGFEEGGGIEEHEHDHDLALSVKQEVQEVQEVYDLDLYLYLYLYLYLDLEQEVQVVNSEGHRPSVEGDADIDVH